MPWLSITVMAPLVAAGLLLVIPAASKGAVRVVSAVASLVALWGALEVGFAYDLHEGGIQLRESFPLVPSLGINWDLAVDGWGVSLLLLTGLILFAGVFATWTLQDREKDFYILLLTLVAGVLGVFVSLDLFVFFLFYEIAVLPMYLLIGIWGSTKQVPPQGPLAFALRRLDVGGREYAAMKLTLMLLIGSAFILVGIFALYQGGGSTDFGMLHLAEHKLPRSTQMWVFPALWLGFGSLAGVFPFHTWSPDGHASAPTAVSMLHAGVLMKLGAFGVMRVGMVLCPEAAAAWAPIVGAVAVINVVYGALSAMSQTDLKYIVAYSSVSHMGVVMLGAATLSTDGWNGAVFQMFAHGLMTGLFFALVGLVYGRAHDREIFNMGGFAKVMPGVAVFFTLAGLSSLGMPGFAGFVAEFLVFLGAFRSGHWVWGLAGIVGAWITAIYVLRAVRAIFWGEGPPKQYHELSDAKGPEWVALMLLGGCLLAFGCWPRLVLDAIDIGTALHLPALGLAVSP
jgi:NADH-quinone oxidoreductase subunit M